MGESFYRRRLPNNAIAFASREGRRVFSEALSTDGLGGYFRLAEQLHTQSDPAFCGLASLVVALNALGIDPQRTWKGPWRWFSEELLDCCASLDEVRQRGLTLDELACLARCNGADVELHRPGLSSPAAWRGALAIANSGQGVVVASYDRQGLEQTGRGHFSPIGGYDSREDLALILDVARFKYPPHWVSAQMIWEAMQDIDPNTGQSRGWVILRRGREKPRLDFDACCATLVSPRSKEVAAE